jgi:adenylate kinase family enzyme
MRRFVLLLGRHGSGKGTIGRLAEERGLVQFLSAGETLRVATRTEGERARRNDALLSAGRKVPTEESYPLIREAIDRLAPGDVLLDGCPHRHDEVELVHDLFDREPELVLELDVPLEIALARIQARLTCQTCEAPYGPYVRAEPDGTCRRCGGLVERRTDDSFESISRKFETWDHEARRIMRYYAAQTAVARIDGTLAPELVATEVARRLREALPPAYDPKRPREKKRAHSGEAPPRV